MKGQRSGSAERVCAQPAKSLPCLALHASQKRKENNLTQNLAPYSSFVALQVFHSEKVLMKRSWREAEFFCEEFGAQLASFAHIEEEEFVNELLHSKFNR